MSEEKEVTKSETVGDRTVIRPISGKEKGQPRIATSSRFIQDSRKKELVMPNRLCTFDQMAADDAIWTSIDSTNVPVLLALSGGEFIAGPSKSSVSKEAAEFLNYNIRNMSFGTWLGAMNNACTDIRDGFSILNIVTEKRTTGQYKNMYCLKKLSPRTQSSVFGWVWDKNYREVLGFVQKPSLKKAKQPTEAQFERGLTAASAVIQNNLYPYLKNETLLWFKYNTTDNNPEGDSPLMHCYDAWMEKKLVESYEVIGVTKDMGGLLVVRVPPELIEKANDPEIYQAEAQEYLDLQTDAAKLHAGESSFILLSSQADPVTKHYDFDIDLKGVDGGGKQYKTSEIIDQKRKSIYNVFGASHVILGQDGGGSYALSSSKVSIHEMYIKRNLEFKADVLNNQLVPTLLKANNIHLNWKDMPTFRPAEPSEMSLDEVGKFVQRIQSVTMMTPEMWEHLARITGLPLEGIRELDYTNKGESRSGESQGTSGTGDTQSGGKSSDTNSENGGVTKSLIVDGDRIIDTETGKTINLQDLAEEGNYKQ